MPVDPDDVRRGAALEARISARGVRLEPVGNGVARVSWSSALQAEGVEAAAAAVAEELTLAFDLLKQARVEALVDPDDVVATRIATWAGLRREGLLRGVVDVDGVRRDRVVLARLHTDAPPSERTGFRALLNSFLPRKRAIAQLLVRDPDGRVLLCGLTYKEDWDLPGGVVEVDEAPHLAVGREVAEELALDLRVGPLVLVDWLPPWGGWDDAVCLVFDGGVHQPELLEAVVPQAREIRAVAFCTPQEVRARCADFTARRVEAASAVLRGWSGGAGEAGPGAGYAESGRLLRGTGP